jgi:hypoxanthine phosphoribosyltransferase
MENLEEKLKVMFTEDEIQKRIKELAEQIDKDYNGKEIVVISILKGAIFFTVDLVKKMKTPIQLEVMQVSSYAGTESTGNVIVKKGLDTDIAGKDVLIVEDIIDTGYTLKYLKEYLQSLNPKTLKIAVLADKKERRKAEIKIDYTGFEIENKFVVGYGFDVDELGRNIPYIGYLENE